MHISIGLIFMLCWPMFRLINKHITTWLYLHIPIKFTLMQNVLHCLCSAGKRGAILASLVPGLNIIKMFLVGSGALQDEDTVKSMSRSGDPRLFLFA